MTDPRFFPVSGSYTLKKLADVCGAEIAGAADVKAEFAGVAPLRKAGPRDVSFLDNKIYIDDFTTSLAGACIVHPDLADRAPNTMSLLLTSEPYHGYARLAGLFHPPAFGDAVIDAFAVVDDSAKLGNDCRVDAGACISRQAEIGNRCHIGANAVIGDGVILGDDCVVGPCASLICCILGDRVVVHAGVRIGQDGFGFALGKEGHLKVPQLGRVLVEDDVEIGANTTIDRGTGPDTIIGAGSKIDNLVQIAHNVQLGKGCIIVSQVGISGSTRVGDFAMMGGQAGLTGHLHIGDGARIAAQSGVMRDVEAGTSVGGSPASLSRDWLRGVATLERLTRKKGK